jgi:hypothetical protein
MRTFPDCCIGAGPSISPPAVQYTIVVDEVANDVTATDGVSRHHLVYGGTMLLAVVQDPATSVKVSFEHVGLVEPNVVRGISVPRGRPWPTNSVNARMSGPAESEPSTSVERCPSRSQPQRAAPSQSRSSDGLRGRRMAEPIRRPAPAARRPANKCLTPATEHWPRALTTFATQLPQTQPTPRTSRAAATAASPDGAEAPHRGPAAAPPRAWILSPQPQGSRVD